MLISLIAGELTQQTFGPAIDRAFFWGSVNIFRKRSFETCCKEKPPMKFRFTLPVIALLVSTLFLGACSR